VKVVGEYGQGERSVGELEVYDGIYTAIKRFMLSEILMLARFPRTPFQQSCTEHPGITIQISKLIAKRIEIWWTTPVFENGIVKDSMDGATTVMSTLNLRTVAVLPVTLGVPVGGVRRQAAERTQPDRVTKWGDIPQPSGDPKSPRTSCIQQDG
jgi:lysophospholipid hydrolase